MVQGSAGFTYDNGPDGKRYAVGGEVSIDSSKIPDDPRANLAKAQKIRRAALASSEPSSTERSAAASASRMEAGARVEIAELAGDKQSADKEGNDSDEDFLISGSKQNEENIENSYKQIQNNQILQQRAAVDFYI